MLVAHRNYWRVAQIWAVLSVVFLVCLGLFRFELLTAELQNETSLVKRAVSQLVDQHDAHLTSLSTLANSNDAAPILFENVAAAIKQYYSRITTIDLVSLNSAGKGVAAGIIRKAASSSSGSLVLRPSIRHQNSYLLIKRSPNNENAKFGLSLEINTVALLKDISLYWQNPSAGISLDLPSGESLYKKIPKLSSRVLSPIEFQGVLSSNSQPLIVSTIYSPGFANILPAILVWPGLFVLLLIVMLLSYLWRQMILTRHAEQRARLGEYDARLAHASRVNSLGEVASGIAHEMTQPLSAIVSQSQAAKRFMQGDEVDLDQISEILDLNISQSKRAAKIVARLRDWTRPSKLSSEDVDINLAIDNVLQLLREESGKHLIALGVDLKKALPTVQGSTVELEQVIFNLVRNAFDSINQSNSKLRNVLISTYLDNSELVIEVQDSGSGLSANIADRAFVPFVSSKENGTGLGLALCERIVENLDGSIRFIEVERGAKVEVRLPI